MIQVIGINHKIEVKIREKLSIIPKRMESSLKSLLQICDEAVIVSTCNRTEVYVNAENNGSDFVESIFDALNWEKKYINSIYYHLDEGSVEHLFRVVCGFDSMLLGEDQILGQIKEAYDISLKSNAVKSELSRLFQTVVTCGKEFRCQTELCKIPISLSSLVVREAIKRGAKSFMLLGFGEIGRLAAEYITAQNYHKLYIAVRNTDVVDIIDHKVIPIPFTEKSIHYEDVDCIISCTSAPHPVVHKSELPNKRKLLIFDMAVPRDVESLVYDMENVIIYDTDGIGKLKDVSLQKRTSIMEQNKYLIDEYINEYSSWKKVKELSPFIQKIKECGDLVYEQRFNTFVNKKHSKDNEKLAKTLLKSTSNAYVNKAIEVLKEEHLKGRGEECQKILERIFQA